MAGNSSPNQATQVNPPIDVMSAFTNDPPKLEFIWPGFVAGTVGALVALGATGKSGRIEVIPARAGVIPGSRTPTKKRMSAPCTRGSDPRKAGYLTKMM